MIRSIEDEFRLNLNIEMDALLPLGRQLVTLPKAALVSFATADLVRLL